MGNEEEGEMGQALIEEEKPTLRLHLDMRENVLVYDRKHYNGFSCLLFFVSVLKQ